MAFGQHQTFYLRQQWLNKGLKEIKDKPRFFYEDNHFEVLGVGKNMAKSIRYWLSATKLTKDVRTTQIEVVSTDLAEIISMYDPYIKNQFTLSLLHYLLVTDRDDATTWYWFFNIFNERVFTKGMLIEQLSKWVVESFQKQVSSSTLKKDIDCLIQLYTVKDYNNRTPEDVIKSPFESLGLIQMTTGQNYMKSQLNYKPSTLILYITLLKYFEKHEVNEISLSELVNNEELWGRVFNLDRDTILTYIDEIQDKYPVKFTRTNHLDVIRMEKTFKWLEEVKVIYENEVML
ncbi:DUF4007 family protein [Lysinibacillus sp. OL1_EC]|uniref:DUF4007 family protein n=1 Tax=unclassified Lysinibacillus TaxID=2636778 RepID=UPI00103CF621|nr:MULTISPECIES: DUF4007 family protein [unclassified Lysinibacillus]MCM0625141.1 DUF4007 family protein [Lysinibacillus sp. OL1_EC]TBV87394.1 DUF4007 family protein [Lysinibacillus sp. OL1]